MATPSQPLKDSGDHPPGIDYRVVCTAKADGADGDHAFFDVFFAGNGLALKASFNKQKDSDYFTVGQSYVVFFTALGQ